MTVFDYVALVVIGLSLLLGVLRGAVKEVLSLVGWVAAFFCANAFAPYLAGALTGVITKPGLRMVTAYLALFIGILLLAWLLKIALSELVKAIGLGGLDRALGVVFGTVRGVLLVLVTVLACGMTTLPKEAFWRGAVSAKWFETMATAVKPWLPQEFARRVNFHPPKKA
jgi:membrane protein required for colicin V production